MSRRTIEYLLTPNHPLDPGEEESWRTLLGSADVAACACRPSGRQATEDDGIVKFKSAYSMPETIKRMKKDIADKGIMFFDEIDQAKLAADAA